MSSPGSAATAPARAYQYFISHASADLALAIKLRTGLQSFNKNWTMFRAASVYLDETNLPAKPDIRTAIDEAVRASEYFVLLASPAAADSSWVLHEIEVFLETHPATNIVLVLGAGTVKWLSGNGGVNWSETTALPKDLPKNIFVNEPKYVDMRWVVDSEKLDSADPRFRADIARLVAGVSGEPLDHLIGDDVRQFRHFRRRHILGTTLRAGLAFGCAPLLFLLAPGFFDHLRSFPVSLALRWDAISEFVSAYQSYFPYGEVLLALGSGAALAAGAGIRGALGFGAGFFLLAPAHTISALRTFDGDPLERFVACALYVLSFAVAGALGGALAKTSNWRFAGTAFATGGILAALLRYYYPVQFDGFASMQSDFPVPVLAGPWVADRLRMALPALRTGGPWNSLSFQYPLVVGGAVAGLLLGWHMGENEMPGLAPPRRSFARGQWLAAGALLVSIGVGTWLWLASREGRQLAFARADFNQLVATRLLEAPCGGPYNDGVRTVQLLFETSDLVRRTGPPELVAKVDRKLSSCLDSWPLIEDSWRDRNWHEARRAIPSAQLRLLLTKVVSTIPAGQRVNRLPLLAIAWRDLGDKHAERDIVSEMKKLSGTLPFHPLRLRARYAAVFLRDGDVATARAVLIPLIRSRKLCASGEGHSSDEALNADDGITLSRTGLWRFVPACRIGDYAELGVITAMAADGAAPEKIRQFCPAVTHQPLARFALDLVQDESTSEAIGALDAIDLCRTNAGGGPEADVSAEGSTVAFALKNAVSRGDHNAAKLYAERLQRIIKMIRRPDGSINEYPGTRAACALAATGQTSAALQIAVNVRSGVPEPAPHAILCLARVERLAGRNIQALEDLHLAWRAISHEFRHHNDVDAQRRGVGVELAMHGRVADARVLARECDDPLEKLSILVAILKTRDAEKRLITAQDFPDLTRVWE
jgi:hypothetical protein